MKKLLFIALVASLTLVGCGNKTDQSETATDSAIVETDSAGETGVETIEITSTEQFDKAVKSNDLTLVDFWATWCGPCQSMHPIIEQLSKEYPDVKVLFVDIDQNEQLAQRYGFDAIPTFYLFKNGKPVWNYTGTMEPDELKAIIMKYQK